MLSGARYVQHDPDVSKLGAQRGNCFLSIAADLKDFEPSRRGMAQECFQRWADALSPIGKTWSADVASKGGPGPEVLKGYMDALKRSGATLPRDWSAN